LTIELSADFQEAEWEWKHAVEEEATDPLAWLETQERKRRVAGEGDADPAPIPVTVEAYVLSRYRVGFIGASEERVRVAVADALSGARATGIVGFPIDVTTDGDTFPSGVLLAGVDQTLIATVAPPTVRLFEINETSEALTLCPSGISLTGAGVWGRIRRSGRYLLIGCDRRKAIGAAVQVLSCTRPLILQEDLTVRQHVLTATLEALLVAPAIRATVDEGRLEHHDREGSRTSMRTLTDLADRFARDDEPPEAQLLRVVRPQ
jgi:hypothetical protein